MKSKQIKDKAKFLKPELIRVSGNNILIVSARFSNLLLKKRFELIYKIIQAMDFPVCHLWSPEEWEKAKETYMKNGKIRRDWATFDDDLG